MFRHVRLVGRQAVRAATAVRPTPVAGPQLARRSFAAEASKDIHPPVQVFGVGGKYASALYVAAARADTIGAVEAELKEVESLAASNDDFANFLKDPSVPKSTRVAAIEDIFGKAGFSDLTKNFLCVMAEGNRLSALPKVMSSYAELLRAHRGEVLATVTAALELTPSEVAEIGEALQGYLKPGQTLKLDQKVDRSIVGGLIIDIGENHIDLSIDSKIKQMEKLLQESL